MIMIKTYMYKFSSFSAPISVVGFTFMGKSKSTSTVDPRECEIFLIHDTMKVYRVGLLGRDKEEMYTIVEKPMPQDMNWLRNPDKDDTMRQLKHDQHDILRYVILEYLWHFVCMKVS